MVTEQPQFSFSDLFSLHRNQMKVQSGLRPSKSVFGRILEFKEGQRWKSFSSTNDGMSLLENVWFYYGFILYARSIKIILRDWLGAIRYDVKMTFSGLVVVFLFGHLFTGLTCLFCVRSGSRPKTNSHMRAVRSGIVESLLKQPIRIEDGVDGVQGVDFDSVVLPDTESRVSRIEIDPDHWSISLRSHHRK